MAFLASLLGVALACYGAIIAYLFLMQRRLIYRPGVGRPDVAALAPLGLRTVRLKTGDGLSLAAWYLPPPPGRPVVAYFHGNGGHIGHRTGRIARFAVAGIGVLMLEYRGYGGNPGRPSEGGLYADAEAALEFLAAAGVAPARIALWGESLGSAVAVYIGSRQRVAAIVLEAPFTSVTAIARQRYPYVPVTLLLLDRFDSLSRIAGVTAPLLFLHGERDTVVPIAFGRQLYAHARALKETWYASAGGHEDLAEFGALDVAIEFIERHAGAATEQSRTAGARRPERQSSSVISPPPGG